MREFVRKARGLARDLRRGLIMLAGGQRLAVLYTTLVLATSLLPVGQAWLAKLIVDDLSGETQIVLSGVFVLAGLYALTLILPAALHPVQQTLSIWLEDRAVGEVDRRMMEAGTGLTDLSRIERPAFHDELKLAQESAYYTPRFFDALQYLLGNALTLLGLFLLLGTLHPLLPVVLIAATVPHVWSERKGRDLVFEAMRDRSRAAREMDYCTRITTEPDGAKEVRVFGLGGFFLERFQARFDEAVSEVSRVRLRHLRSSALFGGLHALALAGGFLYVAAQAGAGRLSLGDLALYLNAVIQAESLLFLLPFWFGFTYEMLRYARHLFTFTDNAKPGIVLPAQGEGRVAPPPIQFGIELRDVRFRYPESDGLVLDGVSATLQAGKVTALVGENGAGKSTLVKFLTRMYDPVDGEILLDCLPLSRYDLDSLRRRIAVVYQDFARFSLTLRENVAVGDPDGDGKHVEAATLQAGADEVASVLPHGHDAMLTRRFEGGVELSGGEWQKVATARGFVRDAAFIILDEPTAALDADAERRLFERFRELVAGKTALLISHRFSTVRMADHILVLENGGILESGGHDDLISTGGRYATLYEMQAGRYR